MSIYKKINKLKVKIAKEKNNKKQISMNEKLFDLYCRKYKSESKIKINLTDVILHYYYSYQSKKFWLKVKKMKCKNCGLCK